MRMWKPCHVKRQVSIGSLYSAFTKKYDSNFNFEGETHNFWEIVCVLDGTVGVAADSHIFSVPAGRAIVHSPMTFHRIWADNGTSPKLAIVSFDADISTDITDSVFDMTDTMMSDICDIIAEIRTNFEAVDEAVVRQISPFAQTAVNRLENFVISLLPHRAASDSIRSSAAGVRKYTEIVQCLTSNIEGNLTVEQIARKCSMSPSSVKQIFRHFTGMGVVQFYRRMKMDSAIAMLRQNVSVKEISQRLGYTDPNYFSTVFKRVVGISPTAYAAKMHDTDHKQHLR